MKKIVVILLMLAGLASCTKDNIVECKQLEGSWRWNCTILGGFIGVINSMDTEMVIVNFEKGNKMSMTWNDEIVFSNIPYEIKELHEPLLGKYEIIVSKEDKKNIEAALKQYSMYTSGDVVSFGYFSFFDTDFYNNEIESLQITDTETYDAGIEGGSDFHKKSWFIRCN